MLARRAGDLFPVAMGATAMQYDDGYARACGFGAGVTGVKPAAGGVQHKGFAIEYGSHRLFCRAAPGFRIKSLGKLWQRPGHTARSILESRLAVEKGYHSALWLRLLVRKCCLRIVRGWSVSV